MAKMKWDNFDDEDLDAVEYDPENDGGFTPYDGPIPPANTILSGTIKKAWSTASKAGNPMIKVLWEASGNEGDKKVYNGMPIWDYIVLTKEAAFKWKPFLAAFNLTASDVKNKTIVDADEDGNSGHPIVKIGNKFKPGESKISITTKKEKYQGDDQAKVSKYLMPVDGDDDDEDDDVPF